MSKLEYISAFDLIFINGKPWGLTAGLILYKQATYLLLERWGFV